MSLGDCPLLSSCTKRARYMGRPVWPGELQLTSAGCVSAIWRTVGDLPQGSRHRRKLACRSKLLTESCSPSSCIVMPSTTDIYLHPWLHHHTCSLVLVSALACNGSMLRSTALVPSALATDITRSDIASFRAPSKDAVAIRSDAMGFKFSVRHPCAALWTLAAGTWYEDLKASF